MKNHKYAAVATGLVAFTVLAQASAQNVTFTNVAGPATGTAYERAPSARYQDALAIYQGSQQVPINLMAMPGMPIKHRGIPGVAIFDFDDDGDLDVFVTNGPGADNSLFSSQLAETGTLSFIDVAIDAGVADNATDVTGVCFGDLDNDGDRDLLTVLDNGPLTIYDNNGDGTFSGTNIGGSIGGVSCAVGDIDNDGYLDIAVSNTFNHDTLVPILVEPFALNQHNQLFRNNSGDGTFTDISAASGIQNLAGMPPGAAGITWAIQMVDYDMDGDIDIIGAEDQGGIPSAANGGFNRGFLQFYTNDGTGNFTAETDDLFVGEWMGLATADFNGDGTLDTFATNFGDYFLPLIGIPTSLGEYPSRWFLGDGNANWTDPGIGGLVANVFGWGCTAQDFDNDGDSDLLFQGGLDMHFLLDSSNSGAMYINDGSANFSFDTGAFATDYVRHNVQGMAAGDLDGDGFVDVVTASNLFVAAPIPIVPYAAVGLQYGSPHDPAAFFSPGFVETAPGSGQFVWTGLQPDNGPVTIEMNNGDNNNESITVDTVGTVGITSNGGVNRDGIGATITVTPHNGQAQTVPVAGGGSYASQDASAKVIGVGQSSHARVDVLWPGAVKNRLYGAHAGTRLTFPEIPCSIDTDDNFFPYLGCVFSSLHQIKHAGVISRHEKVKLMTGAILGYLDEH